MAIEIEQLLARVGIDTSNLPAEMDSARRAMVDGVGTAAQQTQLRIDSLSQRIAFQERQLGLLSRALDEAKAKFGEGSTQVEKAQLAYDRLSTVIGQNAKQLPILTQRFGEITTPVSAGAQAIEEFGHGMTMMVGPMAVGMAAISGVQQAFAGLAESAKEALALREQENALNAVAGSARRYEEALTVAQQQQRLFGGTLRENVSDMQGLVVTARETGASLAALTDLAQRLQIKSPEQGIGGARLALSEALSEGNITSLRRRFEIPAEALAKLRDQSLSVEDRLAVLSGYLDRVGISSEAVAGRVDASAQSYRDLNAEWEQLGRTAGGGLADAFASVANGLARMIGLINGNPEALAKVTALLQGRSSINQTDVDASRAFLAQQSAENQLRTGIPGAVAQSKLGDQRAEAEQLLMLTQYLGERSAELGKKATTAFTTTSESADAYLLALKRIIAETQRTEAQKPPKVVELSDEDRERFEGQLSKAQDAASSAYQRMSQAEKDYQQDTTQRGRDHQAKLGEIQSEGAARIAELNKDFYAKRDQDDRDFQDKRVKIAGDLQEKLIALEQDYQQDVAKRQSSAAERRQQIGQDLADRLAALEKDAATKRADTQEEDQQRALDREEAHADRLRQLHEQQADVQSGLASRLADLEQSQLDRRLQAQQAYAEQIASLVQRRADMEADASRKAYESAREYSDRTADADQDARTKAEDRARDHADKLEELQRRAQQAGQYGQTVTLTGQRSERFVPGDTSDIQRQIEDENKRYQREEERAARDEQIKRERAERERQEQIADANYRLEQQRTQAEREQQQAETKYQQQEERATAAAQRAREQAEQQAAERLAQLETQYARQEELSQAQEAKEDDGRARQRDKERARYEEQRADAEDAAAQQIDRLNTDLARDLAERDAAYQQQREKAIAGAAEQQADAEDAYKQQYAALLQSHQDQLGAAQSAIDKRLEQENTSYARQEEQRAAAYQRQHEQLQTAYGEQLTTVTELEAKLGKITQDEADRRLGIIKNLYLQQAEAQKDAYLSAFGDLFGSNEGSRAGRPAPSEYPDEIARANARPAAGGSITIAPGAITVSGVSDPREAAIAVRRELTRMINGGNVADFFGGN